MNWADGWPKSAGSQFHASATGDAGRGVETHGGTVGSGDGGLPPMEHLRRIVEKTNKPANGEKL